MIKSMIAVVAVVAVIAACGTEPTPVVALGGPEDNTAGFGAPARAPGEFLSSAAAHRVTGELLLAPNGCWYADLGTDMQRLVVFPAGFVQDPDDGAMVKSPEGHEFGSATAVDGIVRIVQAEALPSDGKWDGYLTFCNPEVGELAVFDAMDPAFDPLSLSTDELLDLARSADFTVAWPCGRGFAVSTPDERVGILIYERSERPPLSRTASLPDTWWNAELVVGKNLFVGHCNDAAEWWWPERVVAAHWPISAGSLEILDPMPAPDQDPTVVRAVLRRASVSTDRGDIELSELELVNDGYNFFAG